jgi:predicted nucleic acid-binding protein
LARANNLSSYDASYLDLAMRKGFPLATLDNKLIEAARRIDVPILAA